MNRIARTIVGTPLACVLTAAWLWPASLAARTQAGAAPPIEVRAVPSKTLPGGHVTLRGSAVPMGAGSAVSIVVQPPAGAKPLMLQGALDGDGEFSVVFTQTDGMGSYSVQVTAPDGKTKASTTIFVVGTGAIPDEVTSDMGSLLTAVGDGITAAREALSTAPPSPGRQAADGQLQEAAARATQAIGKLPEIRQKMKEAFDARTSVEEDNPEWDVYLAELEEWAVDAKDRSEALRATIKGITSGTERCGQLDRMVEALTFVAEASSYASVPIDKSAGYWSDKVPQAFVARAFASADYKPATKAVAISVLKATGAFLHGGPGGLVKSIPGLVAGAGQFLLQDVMSNECERLEGPLSGTFLGESFTTQGERFLDYTTTLDGKIVLLYEKSAPTGQPIGLVGYVEGNGRFDVRDNPAPVVRLTPGQVLFHGVFFPKGGGYWDEVGQFSRALLPYSFRIPLKGVMAGDSVVITMGAAAHDFSDAIKGRSVYVVMPLGGLVPEIIDSPFALQKAHPIIDRVVRRYPVLKLKRDGKETVVEGTFARDTTNAGRTARVRTQLTLKACSPGCLPLSFSPSKPPDAAKEERP